MRLPQHLLESPFFLFGSLDELNKSIGPVVTPVELAEVARLAELGLPPVTSRYVLAAMFGINPGLVWSFQRRTVRHYRSFSIPKGKSLRLINAPRVALKIVQKWLSVQLQRLFDPPNHVFGFVVARSHVDAAAMHCGATWVFSIDITDFFQTTPQVLVTHMLSSMGFGSEGAQLLASLCCLHGNLAQGAPSSPVLSNICFGPLDRKLADIAGAYGARVTRYADDIVLSGTGAFPESLRTDVLAVFDAGPWRLAEHKMNLAVAPRRLKVHGLLVHGDRVRLTKGYRNRLRAFRHLHEKGAIGEADLAHVRGHLAYAKSVEEHEDDDFSELFP